jgi:hemerythrin-like domain-containing protein
VTPGRGAPAGGVCYDLGMDVTDALLGEHGVFHLLVEQLDDALGRCESVAELRAAAEPLAISLLGHHRVEEETLLTPYERETGSLGPLKCLRHEHEQMNQLVRLIARNPEAEQMREQIRALLDIVRRHLAREEQLLFGLVRQTLPAGARQDSGDHWAQFRGVILPG